MTERIRLPFDRRSGKERRNSRNLSYFLSGGSERRRRKEQRTGQERRDEWARINEWSSIWAEFYDPDEFGDK